MSVDRTLAVAVRVLRQLRRDHRSVAMILLVPPLLLALMWGVYYNAPQIFERAGPMLLGLFPFVTMFLVTSITTLRERSLGTLDRLMVSPIGRGDVMAGYAVAFLLIAAVQTGITVVVGVWLLDLSVNGSLAASVLLVLAQALLGITLGLFLSAFAQSEFQVVQFMPLAILPQIFFAGLLVPIEQMPDVLQLVSVVVPLRYSLEALSGVMLLGQPMFGQELWVESSVTLILPIVVLALSWMTLRRTSDA